jgi:hypothetical protein
LRRLLRDTPRTQAAFHADPRPQLAAVPPSCRW